MLYGGCWQAKRTGNQTPCTAINTVPTPTQGKGKKESQLPCHKGNGRTSTWARRPASGERTQTPKARTTRQEGYTQERIREVGTERGREVG